MTTPPSGPSLAQARHFTRHNNDDNNHHNNPDNSSHDNDDNLKFERHSHWNFHRNRKSPSRDSSNSPRLHHRQDPVPDVVHDHDTEDAFVTHVVQTVSVVQVVDSAGSAIDLQTHYGTPATVVVDPVEGLTETLSFNTNDAAPTPAAPPEESFPVPNPEHDSDSTPETYPIPTPDLAGHDLVPGSSSLPHLVPSVSAIPVSPEDHVSSQDAIPAPTPSPSSSRMSPTFPVMTGVSNSTRPNLLPSALFNNSSSFTLKAETASASSSSYLSVSSSSFLSITSSSSEDPTSTTTTTRFITTTSSTAPGGASAEQDAGAGGGQGGPGLDPPSFTTESHGEDTEDAAPATGVVVGSVVGSIAGAAILVFLVIFALRMRKRKHGRIMLAEGPGNGNGTRGLLPATDGPSGGSGGMTQRSMSLGAALAGLSPKRASRKETLPPSTDARTASDGEAERGFYRVSGRKLPPVILNGGDGYTAPRDSTMTGESVYYRESRPFFDDDGSRATGAPGRLALGAPMRPVSGVPVMRTGPARVAVTEENPFADPFSDDMGQLEAPPRNPTTRSLVSRDDSVSRGSRGSGSRFTEDIR